MQISLKNNYKILKPTVAISGAGPAGISCALEAIRNGNTLAVFEIRTPDSKGPRSLDTSKRDSFQRHGSH